MQHSSFAQPRQPDIHETLAGQVESPLAKENHSLTVVAPIRALRGCPLGPVLGREGSPVALNHLVTVTTVISRRTRACRVRFGIPGSRPGPRRRL